MLLSEQIKKCNLSLYKLSKISGLPQSTISDINTGKSKLLDCNGKTLLNLSKALKLTIEELLELKQPIYKPEFESNMPTFLLESIKKLKRAIRFKSDLLDCYTLEVNSCINVCEIENLISKEHANYLRNKYL